MTNNRSGRTLKQQILDLVANMDDDDFDEDFEDDFDDDDFESEQSTIANSRDDGDANLMTPPQLIGDIARQGMNRRNLFGTAPVADNDDSRLTRNVEQSEDESVKRAMTPPKIIETLANERRQELNELMNRYTLNNAANARKPADMTPPSTLALAVADSRERTRQAR